jgi:hypothetical protein
MNASEMARQSLDALTAARQNPSDALLKAYLQSGSATTGITAYDLEAPAKKLYPVITPLRNRIPRVTGGTGIQANWRSITGINTTGLSAGVSQGNRGGVISTTVTNNQASFAGLGLEDYATYEADFAAKGFDDVKSLAVEGLLRSLMIQEERLIVGGNPTLALGTPATPSLSTSTTGGSLAAATYNVYVVALTLDGYGNASIAGGIPLVVNRTNADGSTDSYGGGSSAKSAVASQATTGATSTISASTTFTNGAVAFAWFWGTASNELLGAITTINSVVISATATGTQNASAVIADNSLNNLVFSGLLPQIATPGSNAYVRTLATGTPGTGTTLTSDGAGGIVEIDLALQSFWDNYRLSPTDIYVNSQEAQNITKKVLVAGTSASQRFVFDVKQGVIAGGTLVQSYMNKFGMNGAVELPIRIHPNVPPGTIIFYCDQLPYPLSNVSSVLRMLNRRDYYQIEWPQRSRKYEYGVYVDEVLQNFFTPAFGVIRNIANG